MQRHHLSVTLVPTVLQTNTLSWSLQSPLTEGSHPIFRPSSGTESILSSFIYLPLSIHLVSKATEICSSISGGTVHSQGSLHFTSSQKEETLSLASLGQNSSMASPHPSVSRTPTSASPNSFFECLSPDLTCNIGIHSCLSCLQGKERIANPLKSL